MATIATLRLYVIENDQSVHIVARITTTSLLGKYGTTRDKGNRLVNLHAISWFSARVQENIDI